MLSRFQHLSLIFLSSIFLSACAGSNGEATVNTSKNKNEKLQLPDEIPEIKFTRIAAPINEPADFSIKGGTPPYKISVAGDFLEYSAGAKTFKVSKAGLVFVKVTDKNGLSSESHFQIVSPVETEWKGHSEDTVSSIIQSIPDRGVENSCDLTLYDQGYFLVHGGLAPYSAVLTKGPQGTKVSIQDNRGSIQSGSTAGELEIQITDSLGQITGIKAATSRNISVCKALGERVRTAKEDGFMPIDWNLVSKTKGIETPDAFALLPDGKMVFVVFQRSLISPTNGILRMVRLNADGSVDSNFEAGARFKIIDSVKPGSFKITPLLDGKLFLSWVAIHSENLRSIRLELFDAQGHIDQTFRSQYVQRDYKDPYTSVLSIVSDSINSADQRFYDFIAGLSPAGTTTNFSGYLYAHRADGSDDIGTGQNELTFYTDTKEFSKVDLDYGFPMSGGRVLIKGRLIQKDPEVAPSNLTTQPSTSNPTAFFAMLLPDGTLDRNFQSAGLLFYDPPVDLSIPDVKPAIAIERGLQTDFVFPPRFDKASQSIKVLETSLQWKVPSSDKWASSFSAQNILLEKFKMKNPFEMHEGKNLADAKSWQEYLPGTEKILMAVEPETQIVYILTKIGILKFYLISLRYP